MSAELAIPATTYVLKSIIEQRLAIAYQGLSVPSVLVTPPPRPAQTSSNGNQQPPVEPTTLTLFMHHAGPNPGWRNMHAPVVDSGGRRVAANPLVLDLQYLLAANGADLEREALLGIGMTALHRNAIVPRPMITAILAGIAPPSQPERLLDKLGDETLADKAFQPESITISQVPVDLDLSTKLWSAFQSPIRPSAMYLVTTVFLDVDETFPAPPLVETVRVAGRAAAEGNDSALTPDIVIAEELP